MIRNALAAHGSHDLLLAPSPDAGGTSPQMRKLRPREGPFLGQPENESESQARNSVSAPSFLLVSRSQLPPHHHVHILTENLGNTQAWGRGADPGPGSE